MIALKRIYANLRQKIAQIILERHFVRLQMSEAQVFISKAWALSMGHSSQLSSVLTCKRVSDLEVRHAIQCHDPVKSGYAHKPGRRPENSGTRSILLQVLRIGREGQL